MIEKKEKGFYTFYTCSYRCFGYASMHMYACKYWICLYRVLVDQLTVMSRAQKDLQLLVCH